MATQSSQIAVSVNTTQVWDVISQLQQTDVNSPEFKELLIRMYQFIGLMANVLNVKDTGVYNNAYETVNGQSWFPNPANNSSTNTTAAVRQVYRKVINFGALPNAGTKSVAHGITITAKTTFTRIYGTATNPSTSFIPLPYASVTAVINNIELNVDATNVNVITGIDRTAYTVCYIVLEYIQS